MLKFRRIINKNFKYLVEKSWHGLCIISWCENRRIGSNQKMTEKYKIVTNDTLKREKVSLDFLNKDIAKKTLKFHSSFDQYTETPLVHLKELAKYLGLKDLFVKVRLFGQASTRDIIRHLISDMLSIHIDLWRKFPFFR